MIDPVRIGDWCTLYRADCLDVLVDVEPFDCVLTDPPYSSGARRDADRQVRGGMIRSLKDGDWFSHDTMTTWGFQWFLRAVFTALRPRLARGGHIYVFSDWRQTPNVYGLLEATGFRVNHCLVWRKTSFGMGAYWRNQHENLVFASHGKPAAMLNRGMGSVLDCAGVTPAVRRHPTEKPIALLEKIIEAIPAETIIDPFMGSGTTGVACGRIGRRFIGCEIDPGHFNTAVERLHELNDGGPLFAGQLDAIANGGG